MLRASAASGPITSSCALPEPRLAATLSATQPCSNGLLVSKR